MQEWWKLSEQRFENSRLSIQSTIGIGDTEMLELREDPQPGLNLIHQ